MNKERSNISNLVFLLSTPFLASVLLMIIAGIGIRPVMSALSDYYEKKSIDSRRPLQEFDVSKLPSFKSGWEFSKGEVIEEVGTNNVILTYLTRNDPDEKPRLACLFVTYYNDPKDKVPHSPDVCYRQDGAVIKKMATIKVDTPRSLPDYPQTEVNLLVFKRDNIDQVVLFCFCVEGEIKCKRDSVRWILGKPGNRYSYFSKIEVVSNYTEENSEEAIELCKTLFRESLQVLIEEYFPRKEDLKRF
jgi:hypothetical protein